MVEQCSWGGFSCDDFWPQIHFNTGSFITFENQPWKIEYVKSQKPSCCKWDVKADSLWPPRSLLISWTLFAEHGLLLLRPRWAVMGEHLEGRLAIPAFLILPVQTTTQKTLRYFLQTTHRKLQPPGVNPHVFQLHGTSTNPSEVHDCPVRRILTLVSGTWGETACKPWEIWCPKEGRSEP